MEGGHTPPLLPKLHVLFEGASQAGRLRNPVGAGQGETGREGETEPLPPTMIIWSPITTAGAQTFFTTLVSIRNHVFLDTW